MLLTAQVPLLTVVDRRRAVLEPAARARARCRSCCALGLFLLGFAGLGDQHLPVCRAAGGDDLGRGRPAASQVFMLVGARVIIPLILAYTAWAYWVFRGKVGLEGYH